jgi:hypothetical protein
MYRTELMQTGISNYRGANIKHHQMVSNTEKMNYQTFKVAISHEIDENFS